MFFFSFLFLELLGWFVDGGGVLQWCADQMGIRKSSEFSPRTVQCPVCRASVFDRIKIYRG